MVCAVWCVPRSTVYTQRGQARRPAWKPQKRGPRTLVSDAVLLEEIRAVLKASAFHTEGHRKVRVRLRPGVSTSARTGCCGSCGSIGC